MVSYNRKRILQRRTNALLGKFFSANIKKTMDGYVQHKTPGVTYTPTISGGIGKKALRHFYEHYFIGKLPPSMRLRLLSRTTGADRIVDELYVSYEHTQEVQWMLPGVPPTNKRVEIIIVSIVSIRGGRLYSEHVYWDQASVLVQVGLLDPKLLPEGVQGVDRLPVVGREAARRILHEDTELEQEDYHNKMIRRARARARRSMNKSARASQAGDEYGDLRSEAEQSLPDRSRNKGKAVQETKPPSLKRPNTEAAEHEVDDASDTETESKAGDQAAYVEDGEDDSGENGSKET
jgi:ketosteroid isomerase-like protein